MTNRPGVSHATLLAVLDDPRSVTDLRTYFSAGMRQGATPPFTGSRFDRLAGGGDRPETCNAITADDLVAVEMLSVQVPPPAALHLLEGNLGKEIAKTLRHIPLGVRLGTDDAAQHIAKDSPASEAWRLLKNCDGIGWVTAGKLLARKRPHLIPVYDDVVRCAYRTSTGFWNWLHNRLRDHDGVLACRLAELREKALPSDDISALRVLDVTMWMRHRARHSRDRCPGLVQGIDVR